MEALVIFIILLIVGYVFGKHAEKKHYASIRKREAEMKNIVIVQSKNPHFDQRYRTQLVCGNVVVAMDYFKMAYAALLKLIGGRVKPFESLLERARREAILRVKEETRNLQGQYVCNIKFSMVNLSGQGAQQTKNASGSIEVFAYGTAIIFEKPEERF